MHWLVLGRRLAAAEHVELKRVVAQMQLTQPAVTAGLDEAMSALGKQPSVLGKLVC